MIQIASGAFPVLPPDNPVAITLDDVSSGTTAYTVPAGSTFYCTWILFSYGTAAGAMYESELKVDGVTKIMCRTQGEGQSIPLTNNPIFTANSGQVITFVHNFGLLNGVISFGGYLQ